MPDDKRNHLIINRSYFLGLRVQVKPDCHLKKRIFNLFGSCEAVVEKLRVPNVNKNVSPARVKMAFMEEFLIRRLTYHPAVYISRQGLRMLETASKCFEDFCF